MRTAESSSRSVGTHGTVDGVRIARVRATAIDPGRLLAAVADPRAGAIDVFVGVVRDHDGQLKVVDLDYHAHPSADRDLADVARSIAEDFDVHAVAVEHRVGHLQVGEIAVVCAVSASHRDAAFEATHAFIDRLKQSVPIWKHQGYDGGARSWVRPSP